MLTDCRFPNGFGKPCKPYFSVILNEVKDLVQCLGYSFQIIWNFS